jgi:hypothetical protein
MKSEPKASPEFERFNALVGKVLSVPKAVMDQREKEYQEKSKSNSKRRGPKPKAGRDETHS